LALTLKISLPNATTRASSLDGVCARAGAAAAVHRTASAATPIVSRNVIMRTGTNAGAKLAPAFLRNRAAYNPNMYSMEAVDVFLSSGDKPVTNGDCREPTSTAMYCLPSTA
jgi:hypothetical protein